MTVGNRILAADTGFEGFEWSFMQHSYIGGELTLEFHDGIDSTAFYIGDGRTNLSTRFLDELISELKLAREALANGGTEST